MLHAESDKDKIEYGKLGIGFLDETTIAIGSEETIAEILKHETPVQNTRALELLNFSKNPLAAFAIDSKAVEKNSPPKKKAENQKEENPTAEPKINIGDKTPKQAENNEENPETNQEEKEIEDFEDFSPFSFFDFLKNADIYGSLNFDPKTGEYNDLSLSLGLLWHKVEEEKEEPLIGDGKEEEAEIKGTSLEVAGFQIGKELGLELLKSFRGLEANLIFRFEKEKVADLILATPEIINDNYTVNSAAKKAKPKAFKLNQLPNLLTNPEFYADIIKTAKRNKPEIYRYKGGGGGLSETGFSGFLNLLNFPKIK